MEVPHRMGMGGWNIPVCFLFLLRSFALGAARRLGTNQAMTRDALTQNTMQIIHGRNSFVRH